MSIAQRPGLTDATAYKWLRKSHDFPDQMNFTLEPGQAEELAAYERIACLIDVAMAVLFRPQRLANLRSRPTNQFFVQFVS